MYRLIVALFILPLLCQAQPKVINGWTEFTPSSDSRLLYLSTSSGNDVTAQTYNSGSTEIGADPFSPAGPIKPYQSLAAAARQLRNGYADWILFKKGDTFANQYFGTTTLFGKNKNEPMLIASYGSAEQRPRILTGNQGFIDLSGVSASHIAFVGLHVEAHNRSGFDEPIGVRIINAPFDNIVIEDCCISKYFTNLTIHDPALVAAPTRSNLIVRRCILSDAYVKSAAHSNAMFIANVDTIVFEENLLDHNGWSNSIEGADATGFRHNSYFQVSCAHLLFRENIVARAAATGGGFRCGGEIYNNCFLSNPKNIQFGTHENTVDWPTNYVSGNVSYNVVLDSRVTPFETGKGLTIQRAKNSAIHHNIIAHFTPQSDYNLGLFLNEVHNIHVSNNIIYNWGNNNSSSVAYSGGLAVGNSVLGSINIDSNDIQIGNAKGHCAAVYGSFTGLRFFANRYYNIANSENWFEPSGSYTKWLSQSAELSASNNKIPYIDAGRNVSSYMNSLNMSGDLDEFLQNRRAMSKGNWNKQFTASEFNNYIRSGFGLPSVSDAADLPETDAVRAVLTNGVAEGIYSIIFPRTENMFLTVFDYLGHRILSKDCICSTLDINLSDKAHGLYFILLQHDQFSETLRVIH